LIILRDTREQLPLEFQHPYITKIEEIGLPVGDYGCRYENGYIAPIIFERKGIGDLFGTFGKGHDRFKEELLKAKELDIKLILLIECSYTEIENGYEPSTIKGISIIKKIMTIWIRYGLVPIFCKNRLECTNFITEFFLAYGRNLDFKKMGYNGIQAIQDNRE
jgi:ERCC4-type nuclease